MIAKKRLVEDKPHYVISGTGPRSLETAPRGHENYLIVRNALWSHACYGQRAYPDRRVVVASGGAEGFDHLLAEAALDLTLPLWMILPNRRYGPYYWGERSLTGKNRLAKFQALLDFSERVEYIAGSANQIGGRSVNFVRNDRLVELADSFLVWVSDTPGTRNCYMSVLNSNVPYEKLGPNA